MARQGWIGVDLDGTLAEYRGWIANHHIGAPVGPMRDRVLTWLAAGKDVRIFTARNGSEAVGHIQAWCELHLGQALPVTSTKDMMMVELWDDRAVQVVPNTGLRADGKP